MSERRWSTEPPRGMGPHYHWVRGLERTDVLIESTEADALLIAAAPQMLEVLREAAEYVARFAEDNNEPEDGHCRRTLASMQEVIAKAKGENA